VAHVPAAAVSAAAMMVRPRLLLLPLLLLDLQEDRPAVDPAQMIQQ
jgi:hypothetical protein